MGNVEIAIILAGAALLAHALALPKFPRRGGRAAGEPADEPPA